MLYTLRLCFLYKEAVFFLWIQTNIYIAAEYRMYYYVYISIHFDFVVMIVTLRIVVNIDDWFKIVFYDSYV